MRTLFACIIATAIVCLAARADNGVPPRPSAKDYAAHGRAGAATIAASIVPAKQVSRMFSPDIAKQYVVVEVAIYPEAGVGFDVQSSDFMLSVGQRFAHADRPMDVAPWPEHYPSHPLPVDVTTDAGIVYQHSNDPYFGQRNSVGTYAGVGVGAPGQPDPPPPPKVDPRIIYDRVQRYALAEGATTIATAGYLYFPVGKRKKSDEIELKYAKQDVAVDLKLPKQ